MQSNLTGLNAEKRWKTRSINKITNRLIELATPRIFDLNQKLLNNLVNLVIMPRINRILTMFSVISPSTSTSITKKKPSSYDWQQKLEENDTVYFHELDEKTIIKFLQSSSVPPPKDEDKVINMLFDEKFFDNKMQ